MIDVHCKNIRGNTNSKEESLNIRKSNFFKISRTCSPGARYGEGVMSILLYLKLDVMKP